VPDAIGEVELSNRRREAYCGADRLDVDVIGTGRIIQRSHCKWHVDKEGRARGKWNDHNFRNVPGQGFPGRNNQPARLKWTALVTQEGSKVA